MGKYLCHNGDYKFSDEAVILAENRAFNYGDGIFETIRCLSSHPLFFDKHYQRLKTSLNVLKIELPSEYNEKYFRFHINKLLQKNRIYQGARVRITFYRSTGGLYTPGNNNGEFIMEGNPIQGEKFYQPENGLKIGIYNKDLKPVNRFSHIKSCNSLFYIMAGIWKQENGLDDCLLVNQDGRIIEGLSSNLFLVKNKTIFPTTTSCGCVDGTMRKTVIDISQKIGYKVKELDGFVEDDLLVADEVFLTNAIQGIQHVAGFKERRYYHLISNRIIDELNRLI